MKKLLTAFVTFLILKSVCFGQNNTGSVAGIITDDFGRPIPSGSVALFNHKDSSFYKVVMSTPNGQFEFKNVPAGRYYITVSSVGYKKTSIRPFDLKNNQAYFLSSIVLATDHSKLKDVNIQGKRPMIEVSADKTVFNIEGSINATGSNAFELLQKSPGVTVDKDDNIILKGKNGVRIYIDGKPSQLGGRDLSEFLRSINSSDLSAIEILTNPSSKYDAAGNAGIINLRLKKNKNYGTNGSVSIGAAFANTPKANGSFSINHHDSVINFFGNYSNAFGQRRTIFNLYRVQNDTVYDQHTINYADPHIHNFKTGLDIYFNRNNSIGFIVNGNFNNADYTNNGYTFIMKNGLSAPQKILYADGFQQVTRSNMNYNINYRAANTKGTELLIDGDAGRFRSTQKSNQPNRYKTPSGTLIEERNYRNNTPTDIDIEAVKTDLETPVGKGKFAIGGKISIVRTKNVFDFYNVLTSGDVLDSARSNKFDYTEQIRAGYVNYNSPMGKKWNMRAGVRMENTVSEGKLSSFHPKPDDTVKRNYIDFFPSAAISFNPDEKNAFSLSYSRRIDRPNYEDLNPFENKIDELTYQKGNAFLKPQYTNIAELTHSYKSKLNTTLSYSHVKDFRTNIIDTTEKNRVFRTVKNLASQDIFNISFSAPIDITHWWNLYFNANAYQSLYKADLGTNKKIDIDITAYNFYMQQVFTITNGLMLELSGTYNSPGIWSGTFESEAMYSADAGIQLSMFRKKANLKISCTDIFDTYRFRGISDFGGVYLDVYGKGESRQLRINYSWRFGNSQVKASRQHKSALEEESKRILN